MLKKIKAKTKITGKHFDFFLSAKKELDKKIRAEGETAVKAFFKEYFELNPDIYGVKWEQYTPYYCDGDACTFGLQGVTLYKSKKVFESGATYAGDFEDDDENTDGEEKEDQIVDASYNEEPYDTLESILSVLETIFGDHARVSVTRDKIETEECEHE